MYNTTFEMKQAKFLVMSKESYHKNKSDIVSWKNRIYMDRTYGIYTYSFEDALIFLEKELIEYFKKNNLRNMRVSERKNKLYVLLIYLKLQPMQILIIVLKKVQLIIELSQL